MRLGRLKLFEKRVIGEPDNPLLVRWVLIRHPALAGIFLHKLCRSDHDRALHDHPWGFISIVLRGYQEVHHVRDIESPYNFEYIEESELLTHYPGCVLFRPASWRHRVIIGGKPAWTLVLVGPKYRRWGFWPSGSWCWWRKYNPDKGICEEDIIYHGEGE